MRVIMVICFLAALCAMGAGGPASRDDDRDMRELTGRVAALEKENKTLEKEGKALKKALAAEERKSDARDKLLAGWFDEYHPHGGDSQYHRNQVQWKTR